MAGGSTKKTICGAMAMVDSAPPPYGAELDRLHGTRVILAAAHLDHDPANCVPSNLRSLCQRCHMLYDKPYHLAQRKVTYRMRWALGDLFLGPYIRP
jgi:hypothetical protein